MDTLREVLQKWRDADAQLRHDHPIPNEFVKGMREAYGYCIQDISPLAVLMEGELRHALSSADITTTYSGEDQDGSRIDYDVPDIEAIIDVVLRVVKG